MSTPTLVALTQDDLLALPSRGKTCSLAVFGTYQLYGNAVPNSIWMLHTYLRSGGTDICEGMLFVPPDSGWESEYGSIYGKDLLAMAFHKVENFPGIPFGKAIDMTYEQALAALNG